MANAQGVDVGQASEQLVHVQLDETDGNSLLGFAIVTGHFVDCLRNIFQDKVKKNFIFLQSQDNECSVQDRKASYLTFSPLE